jgi:uncharacterized protein (TIGR04255 family)
MFEPINEAHAVAEMLVFLQFSPNLTPALPSLMGLKDLLKAKLPKATENTTFSITLEDGRNEVTKLPSGLQLMSFRSDGNPAWILNIGPAVISLHCLDYTRWEPVWKEIRFYIKEVFGAIGAAPVSLSSVGLKYIDRFIWTGHDQDYMADLLLRSESQYLNSGAFQSRQRWHCHVGWFQEAGEFGEILNQLNIDSGLNLSPDGTRIVVSIDHTQTTSGAQGGGLAQGALASENPDAPINKLMTFLHSENKRIIRDLLSLEASKRINL